MKTNFHLIQITYRLITVEFFLSLSYIRG
uniref:Uncharacterized protein n=1 Tax=Lepeophtheirus salmonis TaxID=72036 RepID=A0A0K2VGX6_LEPSM